MFCTRSLIYSHGGVRSARRSSWPFLKLLRQGWPAGTLYVILDSFSPYKHTEVTGWAATHHVDLVFLPAYSSWLNWIESEFAALRYSALNGTVHRTHAEQSNAIVGYIRWHNARAQPKRNFDPNSVIRTWTDYQNKAA